MHQRVTVVTVVLCVCVCMWVCLCVCVSVCPPELICRLDSSFSFVSSPSPYFSSFFSFLSPSLSISSTSFLPLPLLPLREVKVGDPTDPDNMLGALVSKEHMEKVKGYIELARKEGCTIHCGGGVDGLQLPEENKNVSLFNHGVLIPLSSSPPYLCEPLHPSLLLVMSGCTPYH